MNLPAIEVTHGIPYSEVCARHVILAVAEEKGMNGYARSTHKRTHWNGVISITKRCANIYQVRSLQAPTCSDLSLTPKQTPY